MRLKSTYKVQLDIRIVSICLEPERGTGGGGEWRKRDERERSVSHVAIAVGNYAAPRNGIHDEYAFIPCSTNCLESLPRPSFLLLPFPSLVDARPGKCEATAVHSVATHFYNDPLNRGDAQQAQTFLLLATLSTLLLFHELAFISTLIFSLRLIFLLHFSSMPFFY
jgi:hypothetical protein